MRPGQTDLGNGNVVTKVDANSETSFVISGDNTWLPGSYESFEAAKNAFRFCVNFMQAMQDEAIATHPDRQITLAHMNDFERRHGLCCGKGAHTR